MNNDIYDDERSDDIDEDEEFESYDEISEQLISPNNIQLAISCEIGTCNINLDKLQELSIGTVLEFIKWPSKVKLKVNGALFAEGYLIEINGMLGVKISNKLPA